MPYEHLKKLFIKLCEQCVFDFELRQMILVSFGKETVNSAGVDRPNVFCLLDDDNIRALEGCGFDQSPT